MPIIYGPKKINNFIAPSDKVLNSEEININKKKTKEKEKNEKEKE